MKNLIGYFLIATSLLVIISCNDSDVNNLNNGNFRVKNKTSQINLGSNIKAEIKTNSFEATNFYVITKNDTLLSFPNQEEEFQFKLNDPEVGKKRIIILGVNASGESKRKVMHVEVFSNKKPTNKTVSIIKEYPHNTSDYTQGLFFDGDTLFESTGLYGESKVKKYFVNGQKSLIENSINERLFGEGITLLNNKIYELTWKSGKVLVYDRQFNLINEMQLPFDAEGWGLTNNGENLIMSDGTQRIRFLNPENLNLVNEIHVYDNERKLSQLNELELVEDKLYANIYQSNYIAEIDINTGIVLSYIDCTPLQSKIEHKTDTDVLNGIAYKASSNTFFLTGKKWNTLFELTF